MVISSISQIGSNFDGYAGLAELSSQLRGCEFEEIELDFSRCFWFDANMSAALGVVLAHVADRFNNISVSKLRPEVETILSKNRFLVGYGYTQRSDTYGSTLPYRRLQPDDERYFTAYVNQHLQRQEIPHMSQALSRRFKDGILEVFANAATH